MCHESGVVTERIWQGLVVANLLVIVAGFRFGAKLKRAYAAAAVATAVGLGAMLVTLVELVSPQEPPSGYLLGVKVLVVAMLPLAVELAVLLVLFRKSGGAKH